jgi:hypothetical protein
MEFPAILESTFADFVTVNSKYLTKKSCMYEERAYREPNKIIITPVFS